MKKFKNIMIGGIQQKVFNLVLVTLLLLMAAYTAVIIHQSAFLSGLVREIDRLAHSLYYIITRKYNPPKNSFMMWAV